jgi:hypothetical protein
MHNPNLGARKRLLIQKRKVKRWDVDEEKEKTIGRMTVVAAVV